MTSIEVASHVLLWIAVILLFVSVLALARQIGLLYEKFGVGGARIMNAGPQIGSPVPEFVHTDIRGRTITLGAERGKKTFILFISTGCATCAHLMPAIKALARAEKTTLEVILVAFGVSTEEAHRFVAEHEIDQDVPLVISNEAALSYMVSIVPYALVIDEERVLRAKGLINHYLDIESLLNSEETGIRSIEEHLGLRSIADGGP